MTTNQITRFALWGGLALFLIGVLSCGAAFVFHLNSPKFTASTQSDMALYIALIFWTAGIVIAIAGAILKAFKHGKT